MKFFALQRDARGVGGLLGCGVGLSGRPGSTSMMMMMAKYMKQELTSDAEEEGLVPNIPGRFGGAFAMRKVPSLSDLSDAESSLGKSRALFSTLFDICDHLAPMAFYMFIPVGIVVQRHFNSVALIASYKIASEFL